MSNVIFFGPGGGGGGVFVETITGDIGGPVGPDIANNLDLVGAVPTGLEISGNPAAHTLSVIQHLYTVFTVDATPTTIFTYFLLNDTAVTFNIMLSGTRADYTASLWAVIGTGARNDGAGAVEVQGAMAFFGQDTGVVGPTFQIQTVGDNFNLQVIGEAGTDWDWSATVSYIVR